VRLAGLANAPLKSSEVSAVSGRLKIKRALTLFGGSGGRRQTRPGTDFGFGGSGSGVRSQNFETLESWGSYVGATLQGLEVGQETVATKGC
jgi:hypothetical protein